MDEVTQLETQLQISLELPFTSLYKEPDSSSLEHQFFLKAFQTFHSLAVILVICRPPHPHPTPPPPPPPPNSRYGPVFCLHITKNQTICLSTLILAAYLKNTFPISWVYSMKNIKFWHSLRDITWYFCSSKANLKELFAKNLAYLGLVCFVTIFIFFRKLDKWKE